MRLFFSFLPPSLPVLEPGQHRFRIARHRAKQRLQGCSNLSVFFLVFSLFFRLHPVKLRLKLSKHPVDFGAVSVGCRYVARKALASAAPELMEQHFAVFDGAGKAYRTEAVADNRYKHNQQRNCHHNN